LIARRIRLSTASIKELVLNGGSANAEGIAAHDWKYYRVDIPQLSPINWNLQFTRLSGEARIFLRDTVPPGDGTGSGDYTLDVTRVWSGAYDPMNWYRDAKNQGPYPRFDTPGTYGLNTPPLRPGHTYYIGVWSATDATYSIVSSTGEESLHLADTVTAKGVSITTNLPPFSSALYRVLAGNGDNRIRMNTTCAEGITLTLEQGTAPQLSGSAHWRSTGSNPYLDQPLTGSWPWIAGVSYYLLITNTTAAPQAVNASLAVPADLQFRILDFPEALVSSQPSPTITVSWAITNLGPGEAEGYYTGSYWGFIRWDRVWLSSNGHLDSQSMPVAALMAQGTIPSGGVQLFTNQMTLPLSSSGTYSLIFQADTENYVWESDKTNNRVQVPFSFTLISNLDPPVLANATQSGAQLQFDVIGTTGATLIIEAGDNLDQWTPVYSAVMTVSLFHFQDTLASTKSQRFYRARLAR